MPRSPLYKCTQTYVNVREYMQTCANTRKPTDIWMNVPERKKTYLKIPIIQKFSYNKNNFFNQYTFL